MSNCLWLHGLQYAMLPCPSLSPWVCSDSCPLSWWCYLSSSSSAASFSFCLQSFPASGSFSMSWLFASGGQSMGASASVWVLPVNIQDWFPLGDLLAVQGSVSQESIPAPQFEGIDSSALSLLYCPTLISYMTTGKTTFLTIQTLEVLQIQF